MSSKSPISKTWQITQYTRDYIKAAISGTFVHISAPLSPGGKKSRVLGNLHFYTKLLTNVIDLLHQSTDECEKKVSFQLDYIVLKSFYHILNYHLIITFLVKII